MSVTAFDTLRYCIKNEVACFTFPMDASKKVSVKWSTINSSNFYEFVNPAENGFAILTGDKYLMLDIDTKHTPPPSIYETLERCCTAIEKTPGGFHFWFLMDDRVKHFKSVEAAYWDGKKVKGLDIRAKGGIAYTAPSHYVAVDGTTKRYVWMKGDLSTASPVPPEVLEHLDLAEPTPVITESRSTLSRAVTKDPETVSLRSSASVITEEEDIAGLLGGLSPARADHYDDWLRVGMALYNGGYPCELWDEWSRQSAKYSIGVCQSKWRSFGGSTGTPVTVATLWKWLKEDNPTLFVRLQAARSCIYRSLLMGTNGHVANVFHELNPHRYLYSHDDSWYVLQENNTWLSVGSTDATKIPNIYHHIRNDCQDLLIELLHKGASEKGESMERMRQVGETLKKISTATFLRGVLAFLSGNYHVHGADKLFNEKRHLFAFTNGVLDMHTMEFRPIEPTDYITVTTGYPYRPALESEKGVVLACLESMFPNAAVLEYVLRALSTTFEGENRAEFFHALTGVGSNGKSMLMDLCKIVFGDYFRTIGVSYLTKDDEGKDRPLPDLVDARWARMLVASEPEERDKFQVALLKLITGGDEISCRAMYGKNVLKYRPQFKLWILTNDMPKLSKYDQGIERRMRCVHFPIRFVHEPAGENERKRDEGLKGKILGDEAWRYGFLGLLLEAFGRAREDEVESGLAMPEEVREFTQAYMLENNPVGAWLRVNFELTGRREDCVPKIDLLQEFVAGTGVSKTAKGFSEDMVKCNVGSKKLDGKLYYFGIRRKVATSE
jgi:P4 family phage/plasmid primase-like protien